MNRKVCERQKLWFNFKVLSHHLHRGIEENHEKSQSGWQTEGDSKRWVWSNRGMMISKENRKKTWEETGSNANSTIKNIT
jgi:hypothetical protein